jgi:hypothetical protein
VSEVRPGLGPAFDGVLEALLAKNPDDRLPDAASVRDRLATLTWQEPESPGAVVLRRVPSLPTGAVEEGARLVPSATCAGAWTDLRLARDVVLVHVPDAGRALVQRWATANRTALQPVYDVLEEGALVEVRVEPLTANATLATVSDEARSRVLDALEAAGATVRDADTLRVAWNPPEAVALLADVLRARGVSLDGADP